MAKRGLSAADQHARREFSDLVYAVINPSGLADSMTETTAWLRGERLTDSRMWTTSPPVTWPNCGTATKPATEPLTAVSR
jgi:hypothetical protein